MLNVELDEIRDQVIATIRTRLPVHNPDITLVDEKKEARKGRSEEVQQVEGILDRTVRPALQADGGDVEVIEVTGHRILIHYEGACGTCPASTTGTLMAIEGIMRDEFHPESEVIPV